jgi:hypothetical protein
MASYPALPDPDPLDALVEDAVAALRWVQPLVPMPSTRIELERVTRRLEEEMEERSS